MNDKELIAKIKELKQIKPSQDWAFLAKSQIMNKGLEFEPESPSILSIFRALFVKPALALATFCFVAVGLVAAAQSSLPGDVLYPVKRIAEKSRDVLVSADKKPEAQLVTANKRLDELTQIAQTNQVKKIAPALQEYQESASKAAKSIAKIVATTSDPAVVKKLAEQAQKLEENKDKLVKVYGIAGLEEVNGEESPIKIVTNWLIQDLKKRTLNEEQAGFLTLAEQAFNSGDYNAALEQVLKINNKEEEDKK